MEKKNSDRYSVGVFNLLHYLSRPEIVESGDMFLEQGGMGLISRFECWLSLPVLEEKNGKMDYIILWRRLVTKEKKKKKKEKKKKKKKKKKKEKNIQKDKKKNK